MKYDHFSMLPERAFQPRNGRHGMTLEGGGGGGGTSTTYTSNIPEWLRPQTEALLGAATKEYFTTRDVKDPTTGKITQEITGIRPFQPYSARAEDYLAKFSPLQQQSFREVGELGTPEGFGAGSDYMGRAARGGIGTAGTALGYGGMGAQYGGEAADLAGEATGFGGRAADIGELGLGYQGYGTDIGRMGMGYGQQAAGMGGLYEQMATSPGSMQAYMSPYVRNVIEQQKESAIRDAQKANLAGNLGAARQGTYGGARQLLAQTERERNLAGQLGQIEATGLQEAFRQAQQAQQFGITTGLQGLQGAQQGLGTALQGGQLGLQGIGQGIAGQQAGLQGLGQAGQLYGLGMQGAGLGLQGVTGAQAGYGLGAQAGRGLADIATAEQTADLARLQAQQMAGATQQEREQAIINQRIQDFAMQQQYPFQQLSGFSGLLRGYATPTTTVSQYSAYNPAAQFAGLAAQATGAYGAMGGFGKASGGIINEGDVANESENEQSFSSGGIASLDQKVLNDPTSFSPEAIKKGIDNESISKMIGAIGLDQIATARKKADMASASQKDAPQGTVLEDLQQQAMGIDSLPTNLDTQELAGGGIIAFEKGGLNDPEELRRRDEFYKSIGLEGYSPEYTGQESDAIESLARGYLARREAIPLGADELAYRESLRKRPEELGKQREMDRYLALMKFGAAMGGAKTPNFLEAVSQGTTAALPEIAAGERAYRTGTAEAQRGLAELDRAARGEKLKALEAGETAYGRQQEMAARAKEGELDRKNRLAIANIPSKELQVAAQLRKDNPNMSYLDSITQASQAMAPKDTYNATRTAVSAAAKDANAEFMQRATFDPKLQEDMRKAAAGDKAAQARVQAVKSKIQEDIFKLYQVEGVNLSSGRMGGASGATKNDPLGIR